MEKSGTLLVIVLSILFVSEVRSYEPVTGHKPFAELALSAYTQCFRGQSYYRSSSAKSRVVQGDVAMDRGLKTTARDRRSLRGEGVFSLALRPFNWHFYNPYQSQYSRVGRVEQSHRNLWSRLITAHGRNRSAYNKQLFLGGLIHLVEDLTVPAHVVPVYHGPTVISAMGPNRLRPLVKYMQDYDRANRFTIKDRIDSIEPDQRRLRRWIAADRGLCQRVARGSVSPSAVRSETTRFTLSKIAEQVPACRGVRWQQFWTKPARGQYFGRYNIGNRNPLFGSGGVLKSGRYRCTFRSRDSRYANFVFALHKKAIEADMKIFRWGYLNRR